MDLLRSELSNRLHHHAPCSIVFLFISAYSNHEFRGSMARPDPEIKSRTLTTVPGTGKSKNVFFFDACTVIFIVSKDFQSTVYHSLQYINCPLTCTGLLSPSSRGKFFLNYSPNAPNTLLFIKVILVSLIHTGRTYFFL